MLDVHVLVHGEVLSAIFRADSVEGRQAGELMARMRAALRHRLQRQGQSAVLKIGDIEVDSVRHRVMRGGAEIKLTPKEFELLRYLVSHPNVPVPHMKLLQAVWGPDYGEEVEYLRVFINQLRKKIERDSSNPEFLLTEPWIGYRFKL